MNILKSKENGKKSLEEQMKDQAQKAGISFNELQKLYEGKKCPKYGTKEPLHIRKVRGGRLVVFNISDRYRGEKISVGRKNIKHQKNKSSDSVETKKS